MAAEEVLLNLFDSNWFGHKNSIDEPDQDPEKIHESDHDHDDHYLVPKNLNIRSQSEQLLDSKFGSFFSSSENSVSPSSVLASSAKLETIFSRKEAKGSQEALSVKIMKKKKKKKVREIGRRNKSLSELEFEELKGFMDLGFVFTEAECKDSKLVSMIPGLQRFCKRCTGTSSDHDQACDDRVDDGEEGVTVSRPYLSEAWDEMKQREEKKKKLRIDLKIPESLGYNEIYMKDQLRFWAHTVASTVR